MNKAQFRNRSLVKGQLNVRSVWTYKIIKKKEKETENNKTSYGNLIWLLFYSTVDGGVPCGGRKKSPHTSP